MGELYWLWFGYCAGLSDTNRLGEKQSNRRVMASHKSKILPTRSRQNNQTIHRTGTAASSPARVGRANSLHEALGYLPTLAFTRSRIAGHVSELVVLVLFGGGRRGRLWSQYDGCCIN